MEHRTCLVVATLLAALVPLTGTMATDGTGCKVTTYSAALPVGEFYMYGTAKEFWEESNGIPGLQRSSSYCADRDSIPSDTCVIHSETWAAAGCVTTYAASIAP